MPSCVNELISAISSGDVEPKPIMVGFPNEEERKGVELPEEVEVLVGISRIRRPWRGPHWNASHVILALEDDSGPLPNARDRCMFKVKFFVNSELCEWNGRFCWVIIRTSPF